MMRRFPGMAVWFTLCLLGAGPATDVNAGGETRTFLIHIRSLPDSQEQFSGIPLTVLAALDKGYAVSILFDGHAVKVSRLGSWYGGDTTILDRMPVPESSRKVLAEKVGVSLSSFPDNHGDLLRFLRGRGVTLYVNREAMASYAITSEKADNVFTPVQPDQMVNLFGSADVYVAY